MMSDIVEVYGIKKAGEFLVRVSNTAVCLGGGPAVRAGRP
jgi:hypothetical protein